MLIVMGSCKRSNNYHVAILQYVDHPGLDAARRGILDEFREQGLTEGKELTLTYRNAQGESTLMQNIVLATRQQRYDLIITLATPISQAIKHRDDSARTPVIYGVITDPVSAGLVASMDRPGDNNTASSDQWPYLDQMKLAASVFGKGATIGVLFNPGEVNTQYAMRQTRAAAQAVGISLEEKPVYSLNDVTQAIASFGDKVKAIYVPADNTAMAAAPAIAKLARDRHIALIAGDPGTFDAGAVVGLGVDYYDLGKQTGKTAIQILRGHVSAGSIPVAVVRNPTLMVNEKLARELSVSIPPEVRARAQRVVK